MAKVEVSSSPTLEYDLGEKEILEGLLDAFGSSFTLREISAAFCKAGRNPDMAAEILYCERNNSDAPVPITFEREYMSTSPSEPLSLSRSVSNRSACARNSKGPKSKKLPVSIGTVSSVLGKEYAKTNASSNGPVIPTKPLKVDIKDFLIDELIDGDGSSNSAAIRDHMHTEIEEFLFKMLGNGFQLDMDVIREVLGTCGYDAKKSMERLTDHSALKMKNSEDIIGGSIPKLCSKLKSSSPESSEQMDLPQSRETDRYDLQKEVLASLFNVPERIEEAPTRIGISRRIRRPRPGRKFVTEPYKETEQSDVFVKQLQDTDDEKEEDRYKDLRRSALEHWITMKEYFKSAFDAYAKGDLALAKKLTEEGQKYNIKAREADESSSQLNLVQRKEENIRITTVDLRDNDKDEAISKMKWFLETLSGHEGNVKVVMDEGDTKKASLRRRVLKFLKKESIKWTVEGNQGTILIQMNEIHPTELSFYGEKKGSDKFD